MDLLYVITMCRYGIVNLDNKCLSIRLNTSLSDKTGICMKVTADRRRKIVKLH